MNNKKIIIEQPWGGLGDNLQFSSLPEIGEKLGYDVYISNHNIYRNSDIKKLVWDINPYIKGYTNERGNINLSDYKGGNIISNWERVVFGNIYNDMPKLYYKQNNIDFFIDKIIIDPNAVSSKINFIDIINEIKNDKTFLINSNHNDIKNVYTKDIFEWIDIITSCEKFICQYSGASVVMACYNKPCVIYKNTLDETYKFKIHKYINI